MHLAAVYRHEKSILLLANHEVAKRSVKQEQGSSTDVPDHSCFSARDNDWNTPLHLAAMNGHASVAKILIEADGNIQTR